MKLITIATIHQPSKCIWDSFEDVILLVKGGHVAYMGETGPQSESVLSHFAGISGVAPPERCNPGDFCLGTLNQVAPDEAEAAFAKSEVRSQLMLQIQQDTETSSDWHRLEACEQSVQGISPIDRTPHHRAMEKSELLHHENDVICAYGLLHRPTI